MWRGIFKNAFNENEFFRLRLMDQWGWREKSGIRKKIVFKALIIRSYQQFQEKNLRGTIKDKFSSDLSAGKWQKEPYFLPID